MLTIGFCEKNKRTIESIPEYHLVINGTPIWESWAAAAIRGEGKVSAGIDDESALTIISGYSFSDFEPMFDFFSLYLPKPVYELIRRVVIIFRDHESHMLEFRFSFDPDHWAKPWSITQFAGALQYVVRERNTLGLTCFQNDKIISNDLGLRCEVASTAIIEEEINRWSEVVLSVCMESEGVIANRLRKDALVTFFAFPKEIRPACQQYLIYFTQFLEDFGIKATSEIQEQARGVLFTVIPDTGAEALQRVHDALDTYLRFPSIPEFAVEVNRYKDIAVQQLAANVLHLKSQLALAHATLQLKDATIESLHLSLQDRKLLNEPISEKAAPCTDTESGSEPLVGDLVSVTKYKGKGFEINLPAILRRVKRVLKPGNQDSM